MALINGADLLACSLCPVMIGVSLLATLDDVGRALDRCMRRGRPPTTAISLWGPLVRAVASSPTLIEHWQGSKWVGSRARTRP
jgi:hypothetical protein